MYSKCSVLDSVLPDEFNTPPHPLPLPQDNYNDDNNGNISNDDGDHNDDNNDNDSDKKNYGDDENNQNDDEINDNKNDNENIMM